MSGREEGKQEKGEAQPNNVNIALQKKMIMSVGYEFSLYSATIIMIKMQAVCLFGSVLITDRVRDALYT